MPQIALISHVSFLKFEEEEARSKREQKQGKRHFINTTNEQAAMLIMQGLAG